MAKKKEIKNGQYKVETESRITALETNYFNLNQKMDWLGERFDTFVSNHFEHFKDEVFERVDRSKGVPMSITVMVGLLSTLVTGLIMWVVTH